MRIGVGICILTGFSDICQSLILKKGRKLSEIMKQIHVPKLNYSNIEWIDSDDPKYKSRSREAYPYCENCKKITKKMRQNQRHIPTKMLMVIYTCTENAYGNLHMYCYR